MSDSEAIRWDVIDPITGETLANGDELGFGGYDEAADWMRTYGHGKVVEILANGEKQ